MSTPLFLTSILVSSVILLGCSGSKSSSWLDPMKARSPINTGIAADANRSLQELESASICCTGLEQITFHPLDPQKTEFHEINADSQAFNFSTGKSFVSSLEIPNNLDHATIRVDAIAGATVFVPTVLILRENFEISRAISSDQFAYTPAGFMQPQRLSGKFTIDRRNGSHPTHEKYLLIFTTAADLKGSTQMTSEARLYARARGLADPRLPDPVAHHAATGVIRISTSDLETSALSTQTHVEKQENAARYVAPVVATPTTPAKVSPPAPAVPTVTQSEASGQPMLSETQEIYDRMIRESVASGDMDRAWRLVQEAERAGSPTARSTFLKAVERK